MNNNSCSSSTLRNQPRTLILLYDYSLAMLLIIASNAASTTICQFPNL